MWARPWWHVGALLFSAILLVTKAPAIGAQGHLPAEWVPLGPADSEVRAFAVGPNWPADPFMLAVRKDPSKPSDLSGPNPQQVVRSYDAGRSWEVLPDPPKEFRRLTLARSEVLGNVFFAEMDSYAGQVADRLYRSVDEGRTWEAVLTFEERSGLRALLLSPSFGEDHLVLAHVGTRLYRSRDAGATWDDVEPRPGWPVHSVAFSPDFARDGTLFLSSSEGSFGWIAPPSEDLASVKAAMAGSGELLISTDRGETWTSCSSGLEIDGAPYRHIEAVAVSPAFASDKTVFAFAWGAWVPPDGNCGELPRAALFRSQDGGATWQYVWEPFPPERWRTGQWPTEWHARSDWLALSPAFASNGLGLMAIRSQGASPSSGRCRIYRTTDHGATWRSLAPEDSFAPMSCGGLRLAGHDGLTAYWLSGSGGYGWARSFDGGMSTAGIRFRPGTSTPNGAGNWTVLADGTFLYGAPGGIWASGPGVNRTVPTSPR